MTIVLHDTNTIRLIGTCSSDEGEVLLQHLLANPRPWSIGGGAKAPMPP